MVEVFIYIMASFITIPFLATWVVYFIAKQITGHRLKAFHISIHWTTIFYMLTVFILNTIYFELFFGGIIGVILLMILSVVIIYQWKTKTEINIRKAVTYLWRFCFLFFSFIYICFVVYGVGIRIF